MFYPIFGLKFGCIVSDKTFAEMDIESHAKLKCDVACIIMAKVPWG
jgi:hypothetical protein